MKDWIIKNINPPGIKTRNRGALFSAIGRIFGIVRDDATAAFNAHFPYLADVRKLARHGQSLSIPRLKHDTEQDYRERVAAASFYLMRGGERAYIFEQYITHFGEGHYMLWDEFLHIFAKVLDPSDDDRAWAYTLLDRIVNPNVVLTIIDWLQFFEETLIHEEASCILSRRDIDLFDDVIYRDGRVLRDGHTVLNASMNVLRNGLFKRDGGIDRSGKYSIPDSHIVRLPVRRGYRMRDDFIAVLGKTLTDTQTTKMLRNGLIKRDGGGQRRGWIETAFDAIPPLSFSSAKTEQFALSDHYPTAVKKSLSDTHTTSVKRDGAHLRDGMLQRANLVDALMTHYALSAMKDTQTAKMLRNGLIKRDGVGQRRGWIETAFDAIPPLSFSSAKTEQFALSDHYPTAVKKSLSDTHTTSVKRDGAHLRDGMLQRANLVDALIFIASYMLIDFEDTVVVGEHFLLGIRYHRFRDGTYKRDGSILRNSMMLIPLE